MARKKGTSAPPRKRPIESYEHTDKKRINNPPVGLVTPETDPVAPTHKVYDYVAPVPSVKPKQELDYDPHLDPQLVWAGKKEHSSFEVPTVSLHVHERIDPYTIIKAVRKKNGNGLAVQPSLFERPEERRPLREEIDFYKHAHGWSNRLIAGDSLLVMNSLLEKEGMAGQVQMVYLDPPYGKRYNSNFQPFVNKREVKDGKDEDLTQEPEMILAFRDTWKLGIHSYLSYLRDRLLLARDLLTDSGSAFMQIGDENVHLVRSVMDEVFGFENFVSLITFSKTSSATTELLAGTCDYVLLYAKDKPKLKYRKLFIEKAIEGEGASAYDKVELADGRRIRLATALASNLDLSDAKYYRLSDMRSQRPPGDFPVTFEGRSIRPTSGFWKTGPDGFQRLIDANRIELSGNTLNYVRYLDDFPAFPITNIWDDVGSSVGGTKIYVVQTGVKVIERCLLMTTDPSDLVLDPTCGSGTTAFVAEQWGRRWITCDTSRVAVL
jgi:adenine-specific DNA-methyltransferase